MTDAKAIDAQYGMEKGLTALAAGLAGGNLIYESSGMTASLLGASIYRTLRGVEVNEETLGFDAICASVLGDGHFLGAAQTYAAMERDYHYPTLADRTQPITWEENGAPDAWGVANKAARAVLETHNPVYLDAAQDAAIRDGFDILDS